MTHLRILVLLVVASSACSPLAQDEVTYQEESSLEEALARTDGGTRTDLRTPRDAGADAGSGSGDAVWVGSESALDPAAPKLKVTMVDVGQGDGLLIRLPNGKTLAVDGGPSSSAYGAYLTAQGITRLDYVVLSHAHADHYTGLTPVLGKLPKDCAARVYDPGLARTDIAGYNAFLKAAGCRYQPVAIGETLLLDPQVEVTILSAHDTRFGSMDDSHGINNTSVIVRLRYGRFSILLQGDAELTAERATFDTLKPLLRSTVLKAGHHGSCTATGTSYLATVAPQYVLFSVGSGNSYGLPNCQTLRKLRARSGLRWARTDENGTITLTTDGTSYAVTRDHGAENSSTCPRDCASPSDF